MFQELSSVLAKYIAAPTFIFGPKSQHAVLEEVLGTNLKQFEQEGTMTRSTL